MTEKRDEVVYYDTYESMEAMLEKEEMVASVSAQREELQKLQQKARQLEARRGRVSAKKAYLRNKKVWKPGAFITSSWACLTNQTVIGSPLPPFKTK